VDAVNDTCELRSCSIKFTHVHCRRCRKVASTSPCALCGWRGDEHVLIQAEAVEGVFSLISISREEEF
jgi:recombinational DNA repair protein RecR